MQVKPIVIDLGWGELKSALANLPDSAFSKPENAATEKKALIEQYVAAFREVETGAYRDAKSTLANLLSNVSTAVITDKQGELAKFVNGQISKLP